MPSAEFQVQTKWWVLNDPTDFFDALLEIRQDLGWNGSIDVWDVPENPGVDTWRISVAPKDLSVEPKSAFMGNVVMLVAGSMQVFATEAEWQVAYPGLTGS